MKRDLVSSLHQRQILLLRGTKSLIWRQAVNLLPFMQEESPMKTQNKNDVTVDVMIILAGISAIFCFGVVMIPYMHPVL